MAIVGFHFTKIRAERTGTAKGNVGVKHNVGIKKVELADFQLGKGNQQGVRFSFEFSTHYEPDLGAILLEGEMIDILPTKEAKDIVDEWNKNKRMDPTFMGNLLNTIYAKSNVQALLMSKDVGLPPPIKIPKINVKVTEAKK